MIRASDKKLITDFEELVDVVKSTTGYDRYESVGDREKRKKELLAPGNYTKFCEYYFPEYCFAPFGWFHEAYPQEVADNPNNIYLWQWSREFAKSTHGSLFLPMYLKAKDLLTGMILGSHDENMAAQKLDDLRANLEGNQRFINDYGEQKSYGSWEAGQFKTKDGIPFYGFGKQQSPRGYKFREKRPNYGAVDDLNDKRELKNDEIAKEDKDWIIEELKPALWVKRWWLLILQNKFHENTSTALIEEDEQIKCKVHRVDIRDENGNSNWPEYFTNDVIDTLEESEGGGFTRERMNTPFEEGTHFKAEWFVKTKILSLNKYDGVLVHYLDPSYKATEKSDFKAWILLGKTGIFYDIIKVWCERTDSKEMWEYAYTVDEYVAEQNLVKHAMEANFIQEDVHKKEMERVEEEQERALRCFMDYRAKPPKIERILTLAPLFKRGLIRQNEEEYTSKGFRLLRKQLLAIGDGSKVNDDAPDALEGAVWYMDKHGKRLKQKARSGKFKKKNNRAI